MLGDRGYNSNSDVWFESDDRYLSSIIVRLETNNKFCRLINGLSQLIFFDKNRGIYN